MLRHRAMATLRGFMNVGEEQFKRLQDPPYRLNKPMGLAKLPEKEV